jgi:WD40 repeat protein
MTERTIFMVAVEITDPIERAQYLDQSCAGDPGLRQQVESLLAAHEREGAFLDCSDLGLLDEAARKSAVGDTQVVPGRAGAADLVLPFLAPPKAPGSLGRLGHYEAMDVVGKGGMGVVLRAFDEKLHRVVAIKVLAAHLSNSATARQRFVREARAAAAVSHENVIAIHAVEDDGPVPFIVMQFVSGQTLQQKLDRTGPPPLREVLRIGLQIAEGLAAAHKQGLIHRDIKPANILLENGIERVRITDFGLARATDDASLTQSGMIAGTPQYMSPEQAECKPVDQRSDLFSLGGVLYTLCTGHAPFRGPSTIAVLKRVCEETPPPIRELNPEVPAWLETLIARLHAKEPAKRFQNAAEVARLLTTQLAQLQQAGAPGNAVQHGPAAANGALDPPPLVEPASIVLPPRRTSYRPKWIAAGVLLVVGFVIAGIAGLGGVMMPHASKGLPTAADPALAHGPLTLEERAQLPSPLDGARRDDIPNALLGLVGGGDPQQAPGELVAVLGDNQIQSKDQTRAIECSPDGKLLAVSSVRKVLLYEIKTGRLVRTFDVPQNEPHRVAFSPDMSRMLIVAGQTTADGCAEIWDVTSGKRLQAFAGHRMGVLSCAFVNNEIAATGGIDQTVRVWEVATGKQRYVLPHGGHIHGIAASPDGKLLFTACNDHSLRVWDLADGSLKATLQRHTGPISVICFSPNGRLMASSGDGEAIVWDAATFEVVQTLPDAKGWIRFTDDATLFSSPGWFPDDVQHYARRFDVKSGKKLSEFELGGRGGWSGRSMTPDGKTFFHVQTLAGNAPVIAYDIETGKRLVPPQQHEGPVLAVAVSPDGQTLASGGADHTVRLWGLKERKLLHVLRSHTLEVTSLAFSPDGKLLASGSPDTTIELWDVTRGVEATTLSGHSRTDSTIAFSPDGQTIAAGADNGDVKFWEIAGGKAKGSIHWHAGTVRAVAFSPDGKLLASTGADKKVQVVDLVTGRPRHSFALGDGGRQVGFTADGRSVVATCDAPSRVFVWDLESEKERVLTSPTGDILGLACSPVGGPIAASSVDGSVELWGPRSGFTRLLPFASGPIRQVAFTPEGRYLAAAHESGVISLLRVPPTASALPPAPMKLPNFQELAKRPSPADALDRKDISPQLLPENPAPELVAMLGDARLQHQGNVVGLRFIDNDKTLVSLGKDNTVRFWETATGRQQRSFRVDAPPFSGCAISPDGSLLAVGYDNPAGQVKIWDLATEKVIHRLDNAADRGVLFPGMAFSADGKQLVTGGRWYWSKIWGPASGQELRRLENQGCNVYGFAFTPDGATVASGGEDHQVILWDTTTGEKRKSINGHNGAVMSVSFSADGKTMATGSWDGTAKLWDLTGKELNKFTTGGDAHVSTSCLTPDGQSLVVTYSDKNVRIWDVATAKERTSFQLGDVSSVVAISADGRTVAVGSGDGAIRLWDLETYKERLPRQGHSGRIAALAVSPDGKLLATAGEDRTIKLWDLATAKLLRTLTGHTAAVQSVAFNADGKSLLSQAADGTLRWWDPATGKESGSTEFRTDTPGIRFGPDGRWFAIGGTGGAIVLWDAASGTPARRLSGHRAGPVHTAFSPDGKFLASVGLDGVRLWETATGWQVREFSGRGPGYTSVAFSPDGQALALGIDGRTELRDPWTGKQQAVISGEQACFRPDAQMLVSAAGDGSATIWRPRVDGFNSTVLPISRQRLVHLVLSPEGRYLIGAITDSTIYVLRLPE